MDKLFFVGKVIVFMFKWIMGKLVVIDFVGGKVFDVVDIIG